MGPHANILCLLSLCGPIHLGGKILEHYIILRQLTSESNRRSGAQSCKLNGRRDNCRKRFSSRFIDLDLYYQIFTFNECRHVNTESGSSDGLLLSGGRFKSYYEFDAVLEDYRLRVHLRPSSKTIQESFHVEIVN